MIAPWITVDDLEDPGSPYAQDAVESASYVLWLLSARKFSGVRSTVEVYCQMGLRDIMRGGPVTTSMMGGWGTTADGWWGWQVWPIMQYGQIYNMIGGPCGLCGCTHLIRLRGAPVISVESVTVGNHALTADQISIYDYSYISTGKQNTCWRGCDDVTVSYTFGAQPPAAGRLAAKTLADQYVLAMSGSDECELPQRVTQVTRQGMSWTLLDPQEFLDKGRTGLYQVDLFISAVNPDGARLRSRVFSPDLQRGKTKRHPVAPSPHVTVMGFGVGSTPTTGPTPQVMPMAMAAAPTQGGGAAVQSTMQLSSPTTSVVIDEGRPLRWVVPGTFTSDSPPVVTVQPSGEEVPPDTLSWRTSNFTLDLTADQVASLLPPGSVLVVAAHALDGTTSGATSYPTERRTT